MTTVSIISSASSSGVLDSGVPLFLWQMLCIFHREPAVSSDCSIPLVIKQCKIQINPEFFPWLSSQSAYNENYVIFEDETQEDESKLWVLFLFTVSKNLAVLSEIRVSLGIASQMLLLKYSSVEIGQRTKYQPVTSLKVFWLGLWIYLTKLLRLERFSTSF